MIPLFHINQYIIDTSKFSHMLHGLEQELEGRFAEYVGAKYACAANSATSLITLAVSRYMPRSTCQVHLPSIIPCVVPNAVLNGGGSSLQSAVKLTVFLTDLSYFAQVNEVFDSFFPKEPPARTAVQVSALPMNARIEIEAIGYVK